MGEELEYPDGLTAEEFESMKAEYHDEYDRLMATCIKKDGEPRKDADPEDLERIKMLRPLLGVNAQGVESVVISVGDKFKGTDDYTVYVVADRGDELGVVYTRTPWTVESDPFHKLLEHQKVMGRAIITHNVATGLWKYLGNLSETWNR